MKNSKVAIEKSQSINWQHPFVDVLKRFNADSLSNEGKKGNVSFLQDNYIGRKVVKLTGTTSANNFILLPDPKAGIKSMQLTGRYVYVEMQPVQDKYFTMHFEFSIEGRTNNIKITFSNLCQTFKTQQSSQSAQINIPFDKSWPIKWTVMVLDTQWILKNSGVFAQMPIKNLIHELKSVQACSTVNIRGIYTSNYLYSSQELPKEMQFKCLKDQKWNDLYQYKSFPVDIEKHKEVRMDERELQGPFGKPAPTKEQLLKASQLEGSALKNSQLQQSIGKQDRPSYPQLGLEELQTIMQQEPKQSRLASLGFSNKQNQESMRNQPKLEPSPIVELVHCLGFSGKHCPDLRWSRIEDSHELVYPCGQLIVCMDVNENKQRFLFGHSGEIVCMDMSVDGQLIVSAQAGRKGVIKLWEVPTGVCICSFETGYTEIRGLAFIKRRNKIQIITVGQDERNREVLMLWEMKQSAQKKVQIQLVARQVSDFNVLCIKSSPVEDGVFVSCGKENIRFWRQNKGRLSGGVVVLNHHARNTVFTVLEIEDPDATGLLAPASKIDMQSRNVRVFVGSKHGLLFQVSYWRRELEGVFKVHESTICTIAISAGCCVTGSEDQFLRVWPLDFSEFYLEAKHEGVVLAVDVSLDALSIACGTANGGLGIMDLANQSYRTILRSHVDTVIAVEYQKNTHCMITLSADQTIRIWDTNKFEQMYEFSYPSQDTCLCISAMKNQFKFAAGFSSGIFRIFDIEKTCIIEEGKFHETAIKAISYSSDDNFLVVGDSNAVYCVYDVNRNYAPIKTLEYELQSEFIDIAFTSDSSFFATIGDSGSHINFWDTKHFQNILKIFNPGSFIKKIKFATNNQELFVLTSDQKVRVYAIKAEINDLQAGCEGFLLRELHNTHWESINDLAISENQQFVASVGADYFLKVWDYDFKMVGPGASQMFLGHCSPINSVKFINDDQYVCTIGGFEGIYIWKFLGDVSKKQLKQIDFNNLYQVSKKDKAFKGTQKMMETQKIEEEPIHKETDHDQPQQLKEASPQKKNEIEFTSERIQFDNETYLKSEKKENELQDLINLTEQIKDGGEKKDKTLKIVDSNVSISKSNKSQRRSLAPFQSTIKSSKTIGEIGTGVFKTLTMATTFDPLIKEYRKQRRRRGKEIVQRYSNNAVRTQYNLPFKHYFVEGDNSEIDAKILELKKNTNQLSLQFINGYNNDGHHNLIWNYQLGWFAYTLENMIIIEELNKERKQKVVTLPDHISVLLLNKDGTKLVVGSSCVNKLSGMANIYILDCQTFIINKTLSFHTRGIQDLCWAKQGKYLISVGNFRESTIAVWDFQFGKLMSSSYTLDKINEVKASENIYSEDRIFEFCSIGRDQVQFWAYNRENKLEYYDIFIPKKDGQIEEITAFDYYRQKDEEFIVLGSATGEIYIVQYGSFQILNQKTVTDNQIVDLHISQISKRIVFTSLNNIIYFLNFEAFDQHFIDNFYFYQLKLPSSPIALAFEQTLNEGLVSCIDGNLFYVNINEKYTPNIVGTVDSQIPYQAQLINEKLFATIHQNGQLKLWYIESGELIYTYSFPSQITLLFYSATENKLTCYFENNNEICDLSLKRLGLQETFIHDQLMSPTKKEKDYPIRAGVIKIKDQKQNLIIMKYGDMFVNEFYPKMKSLISTKIAEISDGPFTTVHITDQNIVFMADERGKIRAYTVKHMENEETGKPSYVIGLGDAFDLFDNPHGEKLDNTEEQLFLTKNIYKDIKTNIQLTTTKAMTGCYFCIADQLQYLFVRNYTRRSIVKRIPLSSGFPLCLHLDFKQNEAKIFTATDSGQIYVIDQEHGYQLTSTRQFLNGPINNLFFAKTKSRNSLMTFSQAGFSCYEIEKIAIEKKGYLKKSQF